MIKQMCIVIVMYHKHTVLCSSFLVPIIIIVSGNVVY